MSCFYLLTGPDQHLQLAAAELAVLAGCSAPGRVGVGLAGVDVSRAAYTRFCAQQVATAPNLDELVNKVGDLQPEYEDFRIEVYRPAPKVPASPSEIVKALADCICGHPNLDNPRTDLAVVLSPGCWRFGPIISRSDQGWHHQSQRPHDYSNALPPQMARALVNLVAAPGDLLLDPCCGVGTVVAEALAMGVRAVGAEINKKLAGLAAENLRALNLPANIIVSDARTIPGRFDAAVVDFPYGHSSAVDSKLYTEILVNLKSQVRRMAIVTGRPQDELLSSLGLRIHRRAPVTKGGLTRYIYLTVPPPEGDLRRNQAPGGELVNIGTDLC